MLRLLPPATEKVQCVLGNKFGCTAKDAGKLLETAAELELNVVGVRYGIVEKWYDYPIRGKKLLGFKSNS